MPGLHLQMLHPDYDNLFLVGLFQTSTGNWQIMDYQSRLIARYIHLRRSDPGRIAWLRAEKRNPIYGRQLNGGIAFYDSSRHQLQVDHFSYRRRLDKMVNRLAVSPPPRSVADIAPSDALEPAA